LARKPTFFHHLKGTIMFRNRPIDRPAPRRKRAFVEQLESRVNCSIDLSGTWVGTLTHPLVPEAPNWQETVTISGSGNSPSATRLSQDADAPNYYVQWSDTTSLNGNTFQLFDQSIQSQTETPLGTGPGWLQINATLTVSGSTMSGSWTSIYGDTAYHGSIQLTRQSGPVEFVSVVPGGAATVQAGQRLQGYVAEIDATSPLLPSVGLQAQIDDGDGTTSFGTIVAQVPGQVWDVYSTHTYTTPGTYPINVKVSDSQGDTTTFSLKVVVNPPPLPEHQFKIDVTAFIPGKFVPDPLPFFIFMRGPFGVRIPQFVPAVFGGDNRGFDPNASSYRARQEVIVMTGTNYSGLQPGSEQELPGTSLAYMHTISRGPVLIGSKRANPSGMHVALIGASQNDVIAHMVGSISNPLVPHAPPIRWDLTVDINTSGSAASYKITGSRSEFPALEVDINGDEVLASPPRGMRFYGPYTIYQIARGLLSTESVNTVGTLPN
jgi:hypothetical protein